MQLVFNEKKKIKSMIVQELLFTVNYSVSQEITRIKRLTNLIYINMKLILILQPTPILHHTLFDTARALERLYSGSKCYTYFELVYNLRQAK